MVRLNKQRVSEYTERTNKVRKECKADNEEIRETLNGSIEIWKGKLEEANKKINSHKQEMQNKQDEMNLLNQNNKALQKDIELIKSESDTTRDNIVSEYNDQIKDQMN